MSQRKKILLIYTGGTIGMIENPETGTLEPFDFTHLIDNVPKIKILNHRIDNISFDTPLDSSNITPAHWVQIADIIEHHYDHYDGFVVLHGTDTMAYTASALSFMLRNLKKPVIITGSQLPIGEVRTDGEENLITAVQIAAAVDPSGNPMVQEVAILFDDYLWRGNRATKTSADYFNAFTSNNYPPLAKIGLDITFNREALLRQPHNLCPLEVYKRLDPSVMFLSIFPGLTETILRHLLDTPVKGIVMRTFGAGNAPTEPWFIDAIAQAVNQGKVIVNVTQCVNGAVKRIYAAGSGLASSGVVSGYDITAEAAITKLMFLFGQGLTPDQVRNAFVHSICGEMSN